jgi:hypothetical protein
MEPAGSSRHEERTAMPILAIFTGKITKEQYESVRAKVAWESRHPDGALFHCASFDDAGTLRVVDVWESQTKLERFFQDRIGPVLEQQRIEMPRREIYPIHNLNAFEALQEHVLV